MTTTLTAPQKRNELVQLLKASEKQIAMALPRHLTAERLIRMAVTLFSKSDALQKCSLPSIVACVIQASELGLELTGPLGHAFMVPYANQATFQIGYKGFFELGFRSGKLSAWPMRIVYANDRFRVQYGTQQKIDHEPALTNRGEPIGYYSCLYLKDGGRDFEFMSIEDARKHCEKFSRAFQSDQKYGKANSPWTTSFDAMAMKTTVRLLSKRSPLSTELRAAATIDEYNEAGVGTTLLDVTPESPANRIKAALNGNGAHEDGEREVDPDQLASDDQIRAVEAEFHRLKANAAETRKWLDGAGIESLTKSTAGQVESLLIDLRELRDREPGQEG